jgi:hypothetical protein
MQEQDKPNGLVDHVSAMIDTLREERTEEEPLRVTAARVFSAGIDELTDVEMDALEAAGFEAVAREGEPSEIRVPSVVRMIEAGRPYNHVEIDPEDRPKVLFLGFFAIAAEMIRDDFKRPKGRES